MEYCIYIEMEYSSNNLQVMFLYGTIKMKKETKWSDSDGFI